MTIRGFAFIKGTAGENSVALWGPIKLGQKVVCFMGPAHKARTKNGLLYGQAHKARTKSGLLYGQAHKARAKSGLLYGQQIE